MIRKFLLLFLLQASSVFASPSTTGLQQDTLDFLKTGPIPVSVTPGSLAFTTSVRNAYGTTAVTTAAWVQLIASTSAAIKAFTLFDSCGQTLELGTGAAASEVRKLIIPPGGIDGQFLLTVASGTRISIRAVSGNCTTGELDITAFN